MGTGSSCSGKKKLEDDFVGQREQLWCVWWGREKRWEDRDQIPAECEERLSDG